MIPAKKCSLLIVCILSAPSWAPSQDLPQYHIIRHSIDPGGHTSAAGPYALTGTIGQPDAGAMGKGRYELLVGFWPGEPLCIVEFEDFARFADMWLEGDPAGDLDQSGSIDYADLAFLLDYWLSFCPYEWPLQ